MNPLISLLPLLAAEPVTTLTLDDHVVVEVPVATNRVTTVSFPGAIGAIEASGTSLDGKSGSFQLAHTKGASFFSLRALVGHATANLNVRYQRRTYVLLLEESAEPVLALNLVSAPIPQSAPAPRPSPEGLVGLFDKAKAYPLLKAQQPAAVAGVEARLGLEQLTDCGTYRIRVEEVYRFADRDTLVFRLVVMNPGPEPFRYAPDSFVVRVGDRLYPQSLSEASGLVPPGGEEGVYLAITGNPDGTRAELSSRNEFQVLVRPLEGGDK